MARTTSGRGAPFRLSTPQIPHMGARIATIPPVMASAPAVAPDAPPVGAGARLALVVLVALVVLSPWATGSVDPPFARAITLISLATSILALALDARSGVAPQAPIPLWPIAGLWLLGVTAARAPARVAAPG